MPPIMRASDFEFRYRFWIIGALFWAAFSCYAFDHGNAAAHLIELASGGGVDFEWRRVRERRARNHEPPS